MMLETRQGRAVTTWDREPSEIPGTTPHPRPACRRKSNIPFLTQLAQGNTREHLGERDEKGVDQCSVLAGTLAGTTRDGEGGVPGLTYFSFSLEGVYLVSRGMKPKVSVETEGTFCTLHKTVLHSFVLGWEWGSGPPGSGLAGLSWRVVEVEGRCG